MHPSGFSSDETGNGFFVVIFLPSPPRRGLSLVLVSTGQSLSLQEKKKKWRRSGNRSRV